MYPLAHVGFTVLAWEAARRLLQGPLRAAHLALDAMWAAPEVLLWPLLGPMPHGDWAPVRYLTTPFTSPWVLVLEAAGFVALAAGRRRQPRTKTDAQRPSRPGGSSAGCGSQA